MGQSFKQLFQRNGSSRASSLQRAVKPIFSDDDDINQYLTRLTKEHDALYSIKCPQNMNDGAVTLWEAHLRNPYMKTEIAQMI